MSLRIQKHNSIRSFYETYSPENYDDVQVIIIGHVHSFRVAGGGSLLFIDFLDGSTVRDLKCIISRVKPEKRTEEQRSDLEISKFDVLFDTVCRGMGLKLTGFLVKSPPRATQPFELQIREYRILGPVPDSASYVMCSKQVVPLETMRSKFPHLRNQTKTGMAITILKKMSYAEYDKTMTDMDIGRIDFVGFTESDCEGGAEQFVVTTLLGPKTKPNDLPVKEDGTIDWKKDFFERQGPVYETCSAQLELEYAALASGGAHIWTRASRAEPSTGSLHLATFDMNEVEIVCETIEEVMAVAEGGSKAVIRQALKNHRVELEYLAQTFGEEYQCHDLVERLVRYSEVESWPVISHEDAVEKMLTDMEEKGVVFEETPTYNGDFTKEHERYITQIIFGGMPVKVKWYPSQIKSFYMPVVRNDPGTHGVEHADCFDILFPYVGEVVGGSMRETHYDTLMSKIQSKGMNPKPLEKYLDIRRCGSLPHGGFGIGWARLMMVLTGVLRAKEMVEMPRAKGCFV